MTKIVKFSFIFLFLLTTLYIESQETSTYRVIARNGLSVRSKPDVNSTKINKIPYGTKVVVKEKTIINFKVNDNGYIIDGQWFSIINDSISTEPSYVFSGYLKTQNEIESLFDSSFYANNTMFDDFYGVYQFNDKINGIVILDESEDSLDYSNVTIDSYFYTDNKLDEKPYFSNTFVTLFQNRNVTKKYNHYLNKLFYIYYERGFAEAKITKVLFHPDECSENFAVLIFDTNIKKLGKPIFASKTKLKLTYGEFLKEQIQKNLTTDTKALWADCGFVNDSGHIKLFAKYKGYYFGYRNDNDITDIDIDPYRQIMRFDNGKEIIYFSSYLDLFGCPCL